LVDVEIIWLEKKLKSFFIQVETKTDTTPPVRVYYSGAQQQETQNEGNGWNWAVLQGTGCLQNSLLSINYYMSYSY
jgi:hypothetical protein